MGNNRRWIQLVVFSAILLIAGYTIVNQYWSKETPVEIGYKAPNFNLAGHDGQQYKLSEMKGKAVVVNFWGTFCPPCIEEMPALQRQYEQWRQNNVEILGINLSERKVKVDNFIKQNEITFPILLDNDETRKAYEVRNYPTTYFIDSTGIIKDIFVGEMKESDISLRIKSLLDSSN